MYQWAGWLVVAIVCAIAEIFTETFFIILFSVGALVAAALSWLGLKAGYQFAAFILVSLGLVFSTKRVAASWFRKGSELKTNVYALEGKRVVVQAIPPNEAGKVKVKGEVWSARSLCETLIPLGVTVRVLRVEGVHLVVEGPE